MTVNSVFKIIPWDNPALQAYCDKAIKELNEFFNQKWTRDTPRLFVADSRNILNLMNQQDATPDWLVGFGLGSAGACILNPDKIPTESSHTSPTYSVEQLVKHEFCHCFFRVTFGQSMFAWINEGVAVYVSGQLVKHPMPKEFKGFLDGNNLYSESGNAIKLLMDNFGKDKLFGFLRKQKRIEKTEDLSAVFEEVYGGRLEYGFFNKLREKEDGQS